MTKSGTRMRSHHGRNTWWKLDVKTSSEIRPSPKRKRLLLKGHRPRKRRLRQQRPLSEKQPRNRRKRQKRPARNQPNVIHHHHHHHQLKLKDLRLWDFCCQGFLGQSSFKNRARFLVQHCFRSGNKKKKPWQVPQTDGRSLRTWEKCASKMTFGWGIDFHHFQSHSNGMKVKDFGIPTFQWLDYLKINHIAFFQNLWFTGFFFCFMSDAICFCETLFLQLCFSAVLVWG